MLSGPVIRSLYRYKFISKKLYAATWGYWRMCANGYVLEDDAEDDIEYDYDPAFKVPFDI